MSCVRWFCVLALAALGPGLHGQSTHLGVPAGQSVVIEGVITSPTERKWTQFQGGIIGSATASSAYLVPADKKLVITDLIFSLRGQTGKSGNVVLQVKQGVQTFTCFRQTIRLLAGLDQNIYGDHLNSPIVLAEGSELSTYLFLANNGVVLESVLIYGYFLPAGH